ncbi:hypothetical protein [Winogradskyella sp.]|uniref:hypothetical protein n=1 Tax=Winogradskyella sp. TaxID=1883156 RepID=UPI003F694DE6
MKVFKEEQRFTQIWLIILVVVSLLVPIGIILGTYVKNPNNYTTLELITIISIILLASSIIFLFKLSTRIDEVGIHYKFFPFHLKFKIIKWNEVKSAYVRTYDAISEYGGWGLKGGALWNKSNGKAINVSGDIGIQLELKNGKKLLFGTQKQEEAKQIITTYIMKYNSNV